MLCLKYLKFLNLKKIFEGGGADLSNTCPNKIALPKYKSKQIEPLFKYYGSKLWNYFETD